MAMAKLDPLKGDPTYKRIRDLGTGAFGSVILYSRTLADGQLEYVAVKMIARNEYIDYKLVAREIASHKSLVHPHVIRFRRVGLTPDRAYIYMVMEFADKGDLLDYLKRRGRLQEHEARWFFQQLVFGLDYCHRRGVVNRDLKPENLLLKTNPDAPKIPKQHPNQLDNPLELHLKISDFGLSKKGIHSAPKSRVGTVAYMAPEVLKAGPNRPYSGECADVWSAGVVLFVMLFARAPFDDLDAADDNARRNAIITQILTAQWQCPPHIPISAECKDLLQRILVSSPNDRATVKQIMSHPWFMVGLPPAALTMNTLLVQHQTAQPPRGEQSEEEVLDIMRQAEAKMGAGGRGGPGGPGGVGGPVGGGGGGEWAGDEDDERGFSSMIADQIDEEQRQNPYMFDAINR